MSVIVLEMGGSSDLCALLRPGRAGGADGPDRHADRDPRRRRRWRWSAAGWATRCCSRSARRCARPARGCSTSPATSAMRDRYKVEEIERAADAIVWCCDEAPGLAPNPDRPQDRSFVGNIVQAMAAYGAGRLGDRGRFRSATADASDRHRLGPHDAGGRRGPAWRAGAVSASPATPPSARSTRRCSA